MSTFNIDTIIPHHTTDTHTSSPTFLCRCCPNGPAHFTSPTLLLKHQESRMRYYLKSSPLPATTIPTPQNKPPSRPTNLSTRNETPKKQDLVKDDSFQPTDSGSRDGFEKWKMENVRSVDGERRMMEAMLLTRKVKGKPVYGKETKIL